MAFLCRIGLHKFRHAGYLGRALPQAVDICSRCMTGRERYWEATFWYTPEQVKEMLLKDMREYGAEIVP